MNPDLAELLKMNRRPQSEPIAVVDRLLAEVATYHGLKVSELRRRAPHSTQRKTRALRDACASLRLAGLTLAEIGNELGGLHHTTVIHHLKKAGSK